MNHLARNLTKLEDYKQAISIYLRIINNYPESKTFAGLPLVIIARLQLSDCFRKSGEYKNGLNEAINLYEKLVANSWILSESQYITYASMVKDMIMVNRRHRLFEFGWFFRRGVEICRLGYDHLRRPVEKAGLPADPG